ncbi:MAG: guanylate kinase [Candidatus Gastranaerophilales bacterium]|nr:guanylate kinase [Candidatus Gastranaerophilales bacterium]
MADLKRGKLYVVTGPSGVGKGTILEKFFNNNKNIYFSVSMTTRCPRPNEKEGVNYFFVSNEEFDRAVKNDELLEWTEYSGNFYGTSKKFVENALLKGVDVLLEIETQGAKKVMEKFPDCITIFFAPPSFEELESRLRGRHTEDENAIQKRLSAVRDELSMAEKFKYNIVNDEVESAYTKLQAVYDFESGGK